ncbi:MAG TPA: ribonuclease III, partial [Terriglobales bacterium]|nr:ribonuclease III [Terriglobales bacterium]
VSVIKAADLKKPESAFGYSFRDYCLLEQALTHSSYARELEAQQPGEGTAASDNEQLEFLGDAVLGLVTSQELYTRFPHFREGQLSKLKSYLVSEKHLILVARKLHVGKYLRLGHGEDKSGGREKTALQVDALEALVAALYLDGGIEVARTFILEKVVGRELQKLQRRSTQEMLPVTDYKSALQETAHLLGLSPPMYQVVREQGPQHNKMFTIEVKIRGNGHGGLEYAGQAQGSTKKKGEQAAAKDALAHLRSRQKREGARRKSETSRA